MKSTSVHDISGTMENKQDGYSTSVSHLTQCKTFKPLLSSISHFLRIFKALNIFFVEVKHFQGFQART